jgi:hypothetical protein
VSTSGLSLTHVFMHLNPWLIKLYASNYALTVMITAARY